MNPNPYRTVARVTRVVGDHAEIIVSAWSPDKSIPVSLAVIATDAHIAPDSIAAGQRFLADADDIYALTADEIGLRNFEVVPRIRRGQRW